MARPDFAASTGRIGALVQQCFLRLHIADLSRVTLALSGCSTGNGGDWPARKQDMTDILSRSALHKRCVCVWLRQRISEARPHNGTP